MVFSGRTFSRLVEGVEGVGIAGDFPLFLLPAGSCLTSGYCGLPLSLNRSTARDRPTLAKIAQVTRKMVAGSIFAPY